MTPELGLDLAVSESAPRDRPDKAAQTGPRDRANRAAGDRAKHSASHRRRRTAGSHADKNVGLFPFVSLVARHRKVLLRG